MLKKLSLFTLLFSLSSGNFLVAADADGGSTNPLSSSRPGAEGSSARRHVVGSGNLTPGQRERADDARAKLAASTAAAAAPGQHGRADVQGSLAAQLGLIVPPTAGDAEEAGRTANALDSRPPLTPEESDKLVKLGTQATLAASRILCGVISISFAAGAWKFRKTRPKTALFLGIIGFCFGCASIVKTPNELQ